MWTSSLELLVWKTLLRHGHGVWSLFIPSNTRWNSSVSLSHSVLNEGILFPLPILQLLPTKRMPF